MKILHLSDIHFGRNYKCYGIKEKFDDKNKILQELIQCVKNLGSFKPDHIVVTGDIAWHGKRNEFDEAYKWFKELLKETGLSGKNITFCVGNHDVNRAYANMSDDIDDNSISEIDKIYEFDNVHKMESTIYEYDRFCEKLGVEPFVYPCDGKLEYSYSIGYKDVKFPSNNSIRFVAFNTALLSFMPSSKISEDKMWIGQEQIKSLMKYGIIPTEDVHYTIALFHHAERFLHPNEISEYNGRVATLNLLRDNVDLVLCGHTETGGMPILQEQIGGGKLLTAGAAYYSDTHPNAFSILRICDGKNDISVNPFTYNNGWVKQKRSQETTIIKKIKDIPPIGEVKEKCKIVLKSNDIIYEIPVDKLSIYHEIINGIHCWRLDNRKEVLRTLNIILEYNTNTKNVKFSVAEAPKMERDVHAFLERERFFDFMHKYITPEYDTEVYVETSSGEKIVQSKSITTNSCPCSEGLDILEKLDRIQKHYDIKFYRPDEIYENDANKIDIIIELIENGYTSRLRSGDKASASISNADEIELIYKHAREDNSFYLKCENEFVCNLFGVSFNIGKAIVYLGKYKVDKRDVKYKFRTFKKGDQREILFEVKEDFKTYFVLDESKFQEEFIKNNNCLIQIGHMNLDWGFISEKYIKKSDH